jgi:uncharacterized protein
VMSGQNPLVFERRAFLEVRQKGRRLEGYAAKFGSEAQIGPYRETILPGAFATSLGGDILALVDHAPNVVLGRTRSGTLALIEDGQGLAFTLDVPETQPGRDVLALAERGDLGGMSFGFVVPEGGESWQGDLRTLRAVTLKEISIVSAWPAYPDTEIAVRNRAVANPGAKARARRLTMAELGAWA